MDKETTFRHDPRTVCRFLFDKTKWWWNVAHVLKVAVFVVGLVSVFSPSTSVFVAVTVAALSIASEASLMRSDGFKSTAEAFLRKLDLRESFGWNISGSEVADLLFELPKRVKDDLPSETDGEKYFASSAEVGNTKAMHNVRESSWWSKHLARKMGNYCFAATCALVAGSFVAILISILSVGDLGRLVNAARVITSMLMLTTSFGLFRLTRSYRSFSNKSESIERQASALLDSKADDQIKALKIFNEYHLARATAPLLPSWLWKLKRDELNELWEQYSPR